MSESRIATTLVMLAIFAGMSALSLGFPSKASFVPLLVGVPGALLCLAQLVLDLRARAAATDGGVASKAADGDGGDDGALQPREAMMLLWLAVFAGLIVGLGFHVGGPLVVSLYVRFGENESWRIALVAGLATLAVMWLVFTRLLEIPLFDGLVLPVLMR